jgi:uncharacterized protein with PQ loop repeat
LADVLGTVATALSIVFIWPQVFRVYAKRSTEGVSAMGQLQSLFASSLWFAYGNMLDRWPQIISSFNIGAANLLILLLQWRYRDIKGRVLWPAFAVSVVLAVWWSRISVDLVGAVAMIIGGPSIIPQTWRVWKSEHLYGVSVSTYLLLTGMASAWLSYGIVVNDWYTAGPNVIGVPCAAYITWRAWRSHERFRTPEPVEHPA